MEQVSHAHGQQKVVIADQNIRLQLYSTWLLLPVGIPGSVVDSSAGIVIAASMAAMASVAPLLLLLCSSFDWYNTSISLYSTDDTIRFPYHVHDQYTCLHTYI